MLFGTVGASLLVKNINSSDVGDSILIIIVAGAVRFAAMFLVTFGQNLTVKEKILMGITWGSKGSITAIFGGLIMIEAAAKGPGYEQLVNMGNKMQTCSILAILLCTPISSILSMSLGPSFLNLNSKTHAPASNSTNSDRKRLVGNDHMHY